MKLRLVASAKDILIFIMFAIFLLYLVAIGVLNLPQLAAEGTFYGLNPIEAFSPEYIKFTIVFYILFLGGLFFSASSLFFEFEGGFGFGFESKNTGGYSSWAKVNDIKKDGNIKRVLASDSDSEYAGIPLISNGKELWIDNGEYHTLVIGATGAGKTQSTILPAIQCLAKKGESLICTDPKGEIYEKTSNMLRARGYQILLLNFRDPQNGNAWNPMTLPYQMYKSGNQDKAIELLDDLALNILYDESNKNSDPFWEKTSADYFSGVALGLFEDIKRFIENPKHLCGDMSIDDLMVGHSYFMAESEEELHDKVEYEIIPLINEYINDGILNVRNDEKKMAFNSWLSLSPVQEIKDKDQEEDENE